MNIFDDEDAFYTQKQVCEKLALSRQTLYRYRKAKLFPEPVIYVAGGCLRWYVAHVHAWIRENLEFLAKAVATGRNARARRVARKEIDKAAASGAAAEGQPLPVRPVML